MSLSISNRLEVRNDLPSSSTAHDQTSSSASGPSGAIGNARCLTNVLNPSLITSRDQLHAQAAPGPTGAPRSDPHSGPARKMSTLLGSSDSGPLFCPL